MKKFCGKSSKTPNAGDKELNIQKEKYFELFCKEYGEFLQGENKSIRDEIKRCEELKAQATADLESSSFPEYLYKLDLGTLSNVIKIWEDGRATNYQDAINLYLKEKKDEEFREEMRDFEREKIRIQENAEKERMYELRRSQEQAQREMEYHNRQMQDIAKRQADESKRHNDEMEKSAKRLEKMAKEQGEKSNENITIRDYGSIGGGKSMFDIERKKKS